MKYKILARFTMDVIIFNGSLRNQNHLESLQQIMEEELGNN